MAMAKAKQKKQTISTKITISRRAGLFQYQNLGGKNYEEQRAVYQRF